MMTAELATELPPMLTFEQWKQKTDVRNKLQQETNNFNMQGTDFATAEFFYKKGKIKGFAPGPVFVDDEGKPRECFSIKTRIARLNEFFNEVGSSLWLYDLIVYPPQLNYGQIDFSGDTPKYVEFDELKVMEDMVLIRGAWNTQK